MRKMIGQEKGISNWVLEKLQAVQDHRYILIRDPLYLLTNSLPVIHEFVYNNGFTVIMASTNLVFRELFQEAKNAQKLLLVDRTPARRKISSSVTRAPGLFYPDFLDKVEPAARIDLDLRQYLIEVTGDKNWPMETNNYRYASLIVNNLEKVLQAHRNLRNADSTRFTDNDFKVIVAYSSLGIPDSAFKAMDAEDYWRIGLLGHKALEELESLAPEITKPIQNQLAKAPAPFCWFADYDSQMVLQAFYLSVILSQHSEHWNLILPHINPAFRQFSNIKPEIMGDALPRLINLDPQQALADITLMEKSLSKEDLQFILVDQLGLTKSPVFPDIIERERYSNLIRSLALLVGLEDALSKLPCIESHRKLESILVLENNRNYFVDQQPSEAWSNLKEAYSLALNIRSLQEELSSAIKTLKVLKPEIMTFLQFWEFWNVKKLNRLEYFVSSLERLVFSRVLLPRDENEIPSVFINSLNRIHQRVRSIGEDIDKQLDELNDLFQAMVAKNYPKWAQDDSDVYLTSQFLQRCLKPNWDPEKEKAVLFIFDGMRYDIWDEFLRPILEGFMEKIAEYPASSILPSETNITRKAISAGAFPEEFDFNLAEDRLLKEALKRDFGFTGNVNIAAPDTTGTAEVIRYRAGNLEVYIFELCDTELHKINIKSLPDGRQAPSRPIAFIYQQLLKNIIDTEVMAVIRKLEPETKIFITSDHGFVKVGREPIWFDQEYLNEDTDCAYLNCWLKADLAKDFVPKEVRSNIIQFTPEQLRLPRGESRSIRKTGQKLIKTYNTIAFPRIGCSFSRQGSHYNPDAYSHGGISIQEMIIPMVVMKVRSKDEDLIWLGEIEGPMDIIEGQEAEFRLQIKQNKVTNISEIRVDIIGSYTKDPEGKHLQKQVVYVSDKAADVVYRFKPDSGDATDPERRQGFMERVLTITISYAYGQRTMRKSRTRKFSVQLSSERIQRRIPPNLGNILGLTPKGMK